MRPNAGCLVSIFIVRALRGEDITAYGDGLQTRSFCFVSDQIDAFVRPMTTGGECTGPMNLGNPGEFSIREFAERVIAMTGSRSRIVVRQLPSDAPTQRQPDSRLAREKLVRELRVALEEGLGRTIAYSEGLVAAAVRGRRVGLELGRRYQNLLVIEKSEAKRS